MSESADTDEHHDNFEPPTADDGFDEPSKDVKRRNLITAAIIGTIVFVWVVYGLRGALF